MKVHEIKGYILTIYLVEKEGELLLLDGCARPDFNVVKAFIENDLGYQLSDLKLVISTHPHPDHFGALSLFKKAGIPIAGPPELNDWYTGFLGFLTYWVDILLMYLVAINKKRGFYNTLFPRSVELDLILKDGDRIPGFEEWSVLKCPGHTNMDLTLYNSELSLAYIADNVVGSENKLFRPYPLFKPHLYKESLQRYIDLDIQEIMIAHYGRFKLNKEKLKKLIETTPEKSRRHINTLPAIFLKLLRSLYNKR